MPSVARVGVDKVGGIVTGGVITGPGKPTVRINGSPVSVIGDNVAPHGAGPHANATIVQGSSTVFAGGIGIARLGDLASCGHTVDSGSPNVSAG